MATQTLEGRVHKLAKKRIKKKRGFIIHLTAYIVVNIMLVLIWAFLAGGGHPWFVYPLGGWAIGVLSHYLFVYHFFGKSDRVAIKNEMGKMRREQR